MLIDVSLYGVIIVIGVLGIDVIMWIFFDLVVKIKGLNIEGISVYCYIGFYYFLVCIIIGNVIDDVVLIDCMIGVGEVVIVDYRVVELIV